MWTHWRCSLKTDLNAIGQDSGVKVVELTTHSLPEGGDYFTFVRDIAQTIVGALK